MDSKRLRKLFDSVKDGSITVEDAVRSLKHLPYEDISFAKVDHHRHLRQGVPEVIFASGKTDEQVSIIARAMHKKTGSFLITKASKKISNALRIKGAVFYPDSGIIAVGEEKKKTGNVLVLTAGTSDIPVAEEAAVTASFLGSKVVTVYDVGVAGLHRLMDNAAVMPGGARYSCGRGHGGSAPVRCGRHDRQADYRCADVNWLWNQPRRTDRTLCYAQFLCPRHSCHEYR